jgi:Predicted nucleotide-binding protein containing TIR -like domain
VNKTGLEAPIGIIPLLMLSVFIGVSMHKEEIKKLIDANGFAITKESRLGNDLGYRIELRNGCIINSFDTGAYSIQGKNTDEVRTLLQRAEDHPDACSKNVFVVYGHDKKTRGQLEAMLRRWNLNPIILDQLESSGKTIIEKLESYIPQTSFGIVLATPDDVGYPKTQESAKKYRARQNVVLEMGMLLAKLGRENVAILLSKAEEMEPPSDIDGLIYIPFEDDIEDIQVPLAKELNKRGHSIDICLL